MRVGRPRGEDRVALAVVAVVAAGAWWAMRPAARAPRPLPPATPMTSGRDIDVAGGTPWPALATPAGGPIRWPEQALAQAAAGLPPAATPRAAVVRLVTAEALADWSDAVAAGSEVTKTLWLIGVAADGLTERDVYGVWFGRTGAPPTPLPGQPTATAAPTATPAPVGGTWTLVYADEGFTAQHGPLRPDGVPGVGVAAGWPLLADVAALPSLPYGADGCPVVAVAAPTGP